MVAGLFVALWMGLAVGNGDYGTAIAVAGLTVFAILVSVVGKHYRFEGWAIAIVCACYAIRMLQTTDQCHKYKPSKASDL